VTGKLDARSNMCKLLDSWHSFHSLHPWGYSNPTMDERKYWERVVLPA